MNAQSASSASLNPESAVSDCSDGDSGDVLGDVLIVGCGYLGSRVARLAISQAPKVWATTRDSVKADVLRRGGIRPVIVDWTDSRTMADLPDVSHVLVAVAYDRHGIHSRRDAQVGGFRNLIRQLAPSVDITYISTTGVYHQTDGGWVDERTPTRPSRQGGQVHLEAESLLHRYRPGGANCVLRLSGIYGPGRVPRVADVRAGRPIAASVGGWLNLIHVDDAAQAVINLWRRWRTGQEVEPLYCVSDDCPMHRTDFYGHVAHLTKSPPVEFITPSKPTAKQMRSESNKRIWNRRVRRDLLPTMQYQSYCEGLASILS